MKLLITFFLFLTIPYLFRYILKKDVSRRGFALLTSLILAFTFFLLSVLFVKDDSLIIGIAMFVLILVGGYPTQYLLFPILSKYVNLM